MSALSPLWISEAEVVVLMDLGEAIDALEAGLRLQADGAAANMSKTHVSWDGGNTLHAIGAAFEGANIIGTKSWAHTHGGATPLLLLWDAESGALLAIVEAFAMGQMRTGAMSGVATRWMSARDADCFALFGTGKQSLAQLAAAAAVRSLRTVRIWGRDKAKRSSFVERAKELGYDFAIETPDSLEQAADGASILTLATRAREPFLTASMVARGAHINAIGAITPEREEFTQDILTRSQLTAADDPIAARKLSREFGRFYADDDARWTDVQAISALVAGGLPRPADTDLSVFKAMGMGVSDLALGIDIYRRARARNLGRQFDQPRRSAARLGKTLGGKR
ncbi:ornithine cyclodeaminase family protein [Sphingosinicella soli]|uniref:Ornithine cyclodeaminase n=1 Tax=Sphingosinicella soli TaxID=333708 RepID=A0A7W7B3L8_9SPHN|nr:ornithine cyclodeaminase [Sphingosinicella soli]